LAVRIEEQIVKRAVDIVVMRDIPACAADGIIVLQAPGDVREGIDQPKPARPAPRGYICQQEFEKIVERALLEDEPPLHIGLADGKGRVQCELPLGPFVADPGDDRGAGAIAKLANAPIGSDHLQMTGRYSPLQNVAERAKHLGRTPDHSFGRPRFAEVEPDVF
jgi:hypothetical protein